MWALQSLFHLNMFESAEESIKNIQVKQRLYFGVCMKAKEKRRKAIVHHT